MDPATTLGAPGRRPAARRTRPLALALLLAAAPALGGCAYRLHPRDVFAFEAPPVARARPAVPAGSDWTITGLEVAAEAGPVTAWLARRPGSTATLLFFNGNGYSAATAMERLLPRAAALRLDVVALDYRTEGREVPSVAGMRQAARAVRARLATLGEGAAGRVYLGGHSLGAWFALDLASDPTVAGAFLMAPGTTTAEVGRQVAGAPLRWLVRIRPDDDVRLLDGPTLAAAARAPVLLLGSRRDAVMPPEFQQRIAAALPAGVAQRLVVYDDVTHGGFLRDDRVWADIAAFLRLPAEPAAAAAPSAIIAP